jgi:hypothetical protein
MTMDMPAVADTFANLEPLFGPRSNFVVERSEPAPPGWRPMPQNAGTGPVIDRG